MKAVFLMSIILAIVLCTADHTVKLKPQRLKQFTVKGQMQKYQNLDLNPVKIALTINLLPKSLKRFFYIGTYTVINGMVTTKCYSDNDDCAFFRQIKKLLQTYHKKSPLPNFYFIKYHRDSQNDALLTTYIKESLIPNNIFEDSFKLYKHMMIDLPAFSMGIDLDSEIEENLFLIPDGYMLFKDWQDVAAQTRRASEEITWKEKVGKVFWRGVTSGLTEGVADVWQDIPNYFPRVQLIKLSNVQPDLIDAKLTGTFFVTDGQLKKYGIQNYQSDRISVHDHIKYKYLISIDGWTSPWQRTPWILLSNSLLLKQQTNKISWFYHKLQPKVHYYPINRNLSDLIQTVKYLVEHDDEAKKIAEEATKFAEAEFKMQAMQQHFMTQILEYARIQNYTFDNITVDLVSNYGMPFEDVANLTEKEKIQLRNYEFKIRYGKKSALYSSYVLAIVAAYFILKKIGSLLFSPRQPRINTFKDESLTLHQSHQELGTNDE